MSIAFDFVPAHFRLVVDDEERRLPFLDGRELGRWHARYASAYIGGMELTTEALESGDVGAFIDASNLTTDAMVEALLAYDVTGALGDREWVEDALTERQLYLILHRIQRAHA